MPGIDEQIQEQAQPETPQVPTSSYRSIMGANLDLLATLDAIKFEPKVNDGGMYNAVAWIEFWTRSQTGESAVPFADIGSFVEYSKLGLNLEGLGFENLTDWSKVSEGSAFTLPGVTSELTKEEIALFTNPNLKNLSFIKDYNVASGQAKSANPNGGGFNGFLKRFLGLSSTEQIQYSGKLSETDRSTGTVEGATAPFDPLKSFTFDSTLSSQPKWQFLFNPEEIDWEGGPEYAETDAWGVMDPANAGRPLFWKNMRNQRLTFSKVLLNGFVFGKRVDSLEKGLKDLFMSTEGSNGEGPPVLNFVWGLRKFGPCVLKDLRIKEKNWENGVLVNAEVSFVLEKIPEWIINDGFVDVALPGKQQILGDNVLAAQPGQQDTAVEPPPPPAGDTGDGSAQSTQNTPTPSGTCSYLRDALTNKSNSNNDNLFNYRYSVITNKPRPPVSRNPFFVYGEDLVTILDKSRNYFNSVINYKVKYYQFWDAYLSYSSSSSVSTLRIKLSNSLPDKCKKGSSNFDFTPGGKVKEYMDSLGSSEPEKKYNKSKELVSIANIYFNRIDSCVSILRSKVQSEYNSNKCASVLKT